MLTDSWKRSYLDGQLFDYQGNLNQGAEIEEGADNQTDSLASFVDEEMRKVLHESLRVYHSEIVKGLDESDWESVQSSCHKIKGILPSFGLMHIAETAEELLLLIDNNEMESINKKGNNLTDEIESALRLL
ncbi:MAG: Hpt domain-containing protein [Gammaproteobacteria bacterium]|mgnify:FL=1|jgi:HPt (histidine-containing phosphotransfer) domain-containing protein|nr:Hpt domain-containing protein [Gammaproteobacteria bacterium]